MRIIVSGTGDWRYVDCVSIRGGKLEALERVRTLFSVPRDRCVAAGDSGNDILMLEGECPQNGFCLFKSDGDVNQNHHKVAIAENVT